MSNLMWFLPFLVLGVCKSASALQFTKYRKHTSAIVQNASESMMMTTVVGCERYYSTMSTRVIVYDVTHQLCQLYEENAFPLMILPDPSPPQTLFVKGTVYALVQTPMTWINAQLNCEENGGQLIKLGSTEKHDHVVSWLILFPSSDNGAWIGLNDRSTEGSFSWVDGSSLGNFSVWQPDDPNDLEGEDCVQILHSNFKWNDVGCEEELQSLCEYN